MHGNIVDRLYKYYSIFTFKIIKRELIDLIQQSGFTTAIDANDDVYIFIGVKIDVILIPESPFDGFEFGVWHDVYSLKHFVF